MTVVLIIVLVILVVLVFLWALNSMLTHMCPTCHEIGNEEIVIPVIPLVRWWCPTCSSTFKYSEVLSRDKPDNPESLEDDLDLPPRF